MKALAHIHTAVMVTVLGLAGTVAPQAGLADAATVYPCWIDDIKDAIVFYRGDAYYKKEYPHARWELYLQQMQVCRPCTREEIRTPRLWP